MPAKSKGTEKTFSLHWGSGIIDATDIAKLKTALATTPKLRKLLGKLG